MDWPFGELRPFSFDLLMVDFPWAFETYSDRGKGKSVEQHYDTLSLSECVSMAPLIGHLAAKDAIALIWMTHPMIHLQMEVVAAMGMRFSTSGVWVKRTKKGKLAFGTGYMLRCASEPFVIATTGDPEKVSRSVRTVIEGPIRENSRKPDQAYAEMEKLAGPAARRIDVFSRETRPGWVSWGKESTKFDIPQPKRRERAPKLPRNNGESDGRVHQGNSDGAGGSQWLLAV